MKRKIKLKSVILDAIVIAVCIFTFHYSLSRFYDVLNRNAVRTDIERIGSIEFKYKVAQRKFNDRVVWERLQQNSPLYNGDYIRTDTKALAKLTFINQSKLEIGENTMLQISVTRDGDFVISLDSGAVEVETGDVTNNTQFEVRTKSGSSVILNPGVSFSAVTDSQGQTNLVVKQGQAVILDSNGLEQAIEEGQSYVQEKDGKLKKKAISAPSVPKRILTFDEKNVDVPFALTMSPEIENKPLVVEISSDPDFKNIEKTYEKKSADFTIPASSGKTYWRLYSKQDEDDVTMGYVDVIQIPQVSLTAPSNGFEYDLTSDSVLLNFSWTGNDYASFYNFQLASDSNFTQLIRDEKVFNTKYSFSFSQKGKFYWRINPYYEVSEPGYKKPSETFSFSIKQETSKEFSGPKLIYPSESTQLFTSDEDGQLTFIWESSKKYDNYHLLVSKRKDFSNAVVDVSTKELLSIQNFTKEKFEDGTYFWKVIADSKTNEHSDESRIVSFKVSSNDAETKVVQEFVFPEDVEKENGQTAMQIALEKANVEPVEVQKEQPVVQEKVEVVEEPVVQKTEVVEKPKPKPVTKPKPKPQPKPVTKPEPQPDPQPQVVEPKVENEVQPQPEELAETQPEIQPETSEETTEETVQEIIKPVDLSTPVLLEPALDYVIGTEYIRSSNRTVVFIWQPVENATDYTFELYQILDEGKKQRVLQEKNLIEATVQISDLTKLTNGKFEWRVTAYNHTGNIETTTHSKQAVSTFTIQIGLPQKVTPINPGKQYGE